MSHSKNELADGSQCANSPCNHVCVSTEHGMYIGVLHSSSTFCHCPVLRVMIS